MADGIADLAEAFAAAEAALELGDSTAPDETALPAVESAPTDEVEHVEDGPVDDPKVTETATEIESLIPEDGEEIEEPSAPALGSPEFWDQDVQVTTVEGTRHVKVGELRDGYLRQADYTQKTQELAEQRKLLGEATEFLSAFNADPLAFARTLAVRAGLIGEGDEPVKEIEAAKIPAPEDLEAEIQRRVQERLQTDPTMREARIAAARAELDRTFAEIETSNSVKLSKEARQQIVDEAVRRGVADLDLVFQALWSKVRAGAESRGSLKRVAPTKSGSAPAVGTTTTTGVPDTVADAMNLALAELST